MTLWTKAGSWPGGLPAQGAEPDGTIWTDLENNPQGRTALGYVAAPSIPTYDPEAKVLGWNGTAWTLSNRPAPPPAPEPVVPTRIKKYWLLQRFTEDQERAFAKAEYIARNLSPTDLDDPSKEGYFQLQRFLRRLDALTVVDVTVEPTLQAFGLMRMMGIFGDPASDASAAAVANALRPPEGDEIAV